MCPLWGPGRGPPCCSIAGREHRGSLSRPPGCSVALGPSRRCVHRPAKEMAEQKGERVLKDACRCGTSSEVVPRTSQSAPISLKTRPQRCSVVVVQSLSHVSLFCNLLDGCRQAPLSMGFSRQEYWIGLPFPPPGHLPDSGLEPVSWHWQAGSLPLSHRGSPVVLCYLQSKHLL